MALDTNAQMRLPKAAELIANEIRRAIAAGELREGDMLPAEPDLIKRFNVSRPTIRESLRLLEAQSLISVTRGSRGGSRITSPKVDITINQAALFLISRSAKVLDLQVARETVEPGIVGYLAKNATKAEIAKLRALVKRTQYSIDDATSWRAYDIEFHELLIALARNTMLDLVAAIIHHLLGNMYVLFSGHLWVGSAEAKRLRVENIEVKRKLVELLDARDALGAELLWEQHLAKLTELYKRMGAAEVTLSLDVSTAAPVRQFATGAESLLESTTDDGRTAPKRRSTAKPNAGATRSTVTRSSTARGPKGPRAAESVVRSPAPIRRQGFAAGRSRPVSRAAPRAKDAAPVRPAPRDRTSRA